MMTKGPGDFEMQKTDGDGCSVCRELLDSLGRFFAMLERVRQSSNPEWLTVEEVARELKISKSIVYRLIRNGELEAVDLADSHGHIPGKGHYRVKRSCLDDYLDSKRIQPRQSRSTPCRPKRYWNVKDHLGL